MTCCGLTIRHAQPRDWQPVTDAMPRWWGGRDLRAMLPRVFFEHFRDTSFVAEYEERPVAFLVGFLCPSHDDEAYVHFVGVDPPGGARGWHETCTGASADAARAAGRSRVRAVTSVVNRDSLAFHQRLGFVLLPGEFEVDGLPTCGEPSVPGGAMVRFELRLDEPETPSASLAGPRRSPSGRTRCAVRPQRPTSAATWRPTGSPTRPRSRCSRAATCSSSGRRPTKSGAASTRERRHLHRRPQHQLHGRLHLGVPFCAFYQRAGQRPRDTCSASTRSSARSRRRWPSAARPSDAGRPSPDLASAGTNLFRAIKARYPIHIHALSPPEVIHIGGCRSGSVPETLAG